MCSDIMNVVYHLASGNIFSLIGFDNCIYNTNRTRKVPEHFAAVFSIHYVAWVDANRIRIMIKEAIPQ